MEVDEAYLKTNQDMLTDGRFLAEHWHEITEEEAFKINPLLRMHLDADPEIAERAHYFTCDVYDHEGKRCGAHEDRPNICRVYPSQGYDTLPYSATCGYIHNMPPAAQQLWREVYESMRE